MTKSKKQNGIFTVKGEFTIYTVAELKEALLAKLLTDNELKLDLSAVDEFDAAGLQLLIAIRKGAIALGKIFQITQHSTAVSTLFGLASLNSFLCGSELITTPIPQEEASV